MSMKDLLQRWGPVAVCLGIIYVGSEQPAVRRAPQKIEYAVAKISHVLEFAALGAALNRAVAPAGSTLPLRSILATTAFSTIYAASDEFHQTFTPGRTASVRDVVIDLMGALIGTFAYRMISERRSQA
jgi:VanZ family protein